MVILVWLGQVSEGGRLDWLGKDREAIKKKHYEILDIVQNSETPPPRLVWTHKVWTLSLGADPPPLTEVWTF